MNGAQLYLIAILCVGSLRKFVGAEKVDQAHRDSHHEKDYFPLRTKRYTMGMVPLAQLYNRVDNNDDSYAPDKRYRSNTIQTNPVASHFREVQVHQTKRPSPSEDDYISPSQLQSYRNFLQHMGRSGHLDMDGDFGTAGFGDDQVSPRVTGGSDPLSDEELQELLSLLEEYRLQGKPAPLRNFNTPPAQYFTPGMELIGPSKRETGKRTSSNRGPLVLEQPMSFENSIPGDSYPVFLNQKRSKRVGNLSFKKKSTTTTRIKKATDPEVEAELDKIFADASNTDQQAGNHTSRRSTSIPTTPISSSGQIPPPSSSQMKTKKAIDWSEHFGIDKRQENQKHASATVEAKPQSLSVNANQNAPNANTQPADHTQQATQKLNPSEESEKITSANDGAHRDSVARTAEAKDKDKKQSKKKENDADDKADDRKWILKEFYKNLAMSTNVKRKRESPATDPQNDLDKLEKIEKKMEEAGDQIIWDALKYTGAHKDAELSPGELAHVKNQIIQKLAAAYSLEKVREAIEEFRQQLGQLKDKQQYY